MARWLFGQQSQHFFGQSFDFVFCSTFFNKFLQFFWTISWTIFGQLFRQFLYNFMCNFLDNFMDNFFWQIFWQFFFNFFCGRVFFQIYSNSASKLLQSSFPVGTKLKINIWNIPNNLEGTLVAAAAASPPVDRDPRDDKVSSRSNNITIRLLSRG